MARKPGLLLPLLLLLLGPAPARSFGQLPLILNTWPFKNATMAGAGPSRGLRCASWRGGRAAADPGPGAGGREPGAGRPSAAAPPASPAPLAPRRLPRRTLLPATAAFLGPQRRGDSCSDAGHYFPP